MAVLMAQTNLSDPSRPLFKSSSKPLQDDFTERFRQALRDSEAITKGGRDPAETTVSVSTQAPAFLMMKAPSLIGFTNEVDWATRLAGLHGTHTPREAIKFGAVGAYSGHSRESAGIATLGPAREELIEHVGDLIVNLLDWRTLIGGSEKTARLSEYAVFSLVRGLSSFTHAGQPILPLLTEKFEQFYRKIGWWRGPNASQDVRTSVREFWTHSGSTGAKWLIDRIARETHIDVLDGVANLLADIGPSSIDPIIHKLKAKPTRDQVEVLLKALGWIEAPRHAIAIHQVDLENALQNYLGHTESDIRCAACAATRILPGSGALPLLNRRRRVESDPEVLEAIDEALGRR